MYTDFSVCTFRAQKKTLFLNPFEKAIDVLQLAFELISPCFCEMKLSICFHCVDVFLMLYFPVEDAGGPGRQGLSNREAFDARNILKVRHSVLSCT